MPSSPSGFLQRDGEQYANTPETDLFLDRRKPSYIGGILEMANRRLYPFWGHLTEALRTGLPQNEVKNEGPKLLRCAIRRSEGPQGVPRGDDGDQSWLEHDDCAEVSVEELQDVRRCRYRAGRPRSPDRARAAAPAGAAYDLPQVAPIFEEYVAGLGVSDRLRFHPGDFFAQGFPQADVILMGHILHDWDLPTKRMLIKKAFDALPPGGAFIAYEAIIDDDRSKNAFGLLMSLNMLIETPGGFDYTGADCSSWMRDAGFAETRVEPLVGPDSMVIGIKK